MSRVRTNSGFTLIEMLVVMALLGVIMVAVTTLYVSGITNAAEEDQRTELTQSLTLATDNLSDDIKNATAIEGSYSSYTSGSQTVVLDLPAVDSSGNLLYSGSNFVIDRVIYNYTGGVLYRSVVPGAGSSRETVTDQSVLTNITSLSFTYPGSAPSGSSQMSYSVTVQKSFKTRVTTLTGSGTVVLRNF